MLQYIQSVPCGGGRNTSCPQIKHRLASTGGRYSLLRTSRSFFSFFNRQTDSHLGKKKKNAEKSVCIDPLCLP